MHFSFEELRKTGISERIQPDTASTKKKKKLFQEKKSQSCKIFTASHKFQMSNGGNRDDPMLCLHCCKYLSPASSSQAPLPGGNKNLAGSPQGTSQQQVELHLPCHSSDMHQAWDYKVPETSWGFCFAIISIPFQMQLKKIPTKSD